MSKDAFYFKHDSNARNDEKLLEVRRRFGMEGYGIYWAIVEKMREATDYRLVCDYASISWDLRCKESTVKAVVEDFGLFHLNDGFIVSKRLLSDMAILDKKRSAFAEAGRRGMETRWGNRQKNATQEVPVQPTLELSAEEPKPPAEPKKSRQKKYSDNETELHSKCKDIFSDLYRQAKGVEFTWSAKEMKYIVEIIKDIRHQMKTQQLPYDDNDNVANNFQSFISLMFVRADDWIKRNASPSMIHSKFNDIYSQIKTNNNGTRQNATSNNARDNYEFLASIATALQSDPSK